jgi:hypothetical protein
MVAIAKSCIQVAQSPKVDDRTSTGAFSYNNEQAHQNSFESGNPRFGFRPRRCAEGQYGPASVKGIFAFRTQEGLVSSSATALLVSGGNAMEMRVLKVT